MVARLVGDPGQAERLPRPGWVWNSIRNPGAHSIGSRVEHVDGLEIGMHDIKGKALRGSLAKLFGQLATSSLRLGFVVVLARLLEPGDFGLVAMVTAVTAVLELFSTLGLSSAAIQKATISREQMSTLFWINLAIGLVLGLLCVAIAPLLVALYHEPRLFWITCSMGAAFVFRAAGLQHSALLQRQMRFVVLTAIEMSSHVMGLCVGIGLAYTGYGYWALVAAAIVLQAALSVGSWVVTRWVPGRPRWDGETGAMVHFGGTVILNGVVAYIAYNIDKVLVGRVWGAQALGFYGTAAQLVLMPTSNLNAAVGGVTFSTLSRLQNDLVRFRNYFLKSYALVISMTLPVTVFAAVFADDIVLVVLGPKWAAASEIFRMLTPAVLVLGMIDPMAWLLWSSGRQVRSLKIASVIAVLAIVSYAIGLPHGPQGVAMAFSTAMLVWLVPHVILCLHGTTISVLDWFRAAARPLFAALIAGAVAFALQPYFAWVQVALLRLTLEAAVMFGVYGGLLFFVMGQKDFYFDLLKAVWSTSGAPQRRSLEASSYS
jgi:PST family polysaccharide transporter